MMNSVSNAIDRVSYTQHSGIVIIALIVFYFYNHETSVNFGTGKRFALVKKEQVLSFVVYKYIGLISHY